MPAVAGSKPAVIAAPRFFSEAIVVDRQLVLRADLPDDARLHAADALRIDALLAARQSAPTSASPCPHWPLNVSAGSVSRRKLRADTKNQTLSFLIGPPSAPSMFDSLSMPSADFRPRFDQVLR